MNTFSYTGTGSASGTKTAVSSIVTVTASTTYILSGWIDATNVTAGTPQWKVMSTDGVTTTYGSVAQTAGQKGRVQGSVSITAGVTQVAIVASTNNCTVTNATALTWWAPQLEANTTSGNATAYKQNAFDDTAGQIARNAHHSTFTTAIDSSSRLVTSIFDGSAGKAYVPSHFTTFMDTATVGGSNLKSNVIHQEHVSGMTGTGSVNLDGLPDGSTFLRPHGVKLNGSTNQLTWKGMYGDTSADTTTTLVDAGNKRFLHPAMSQGVQSAIDSSGNLLNVTFGAGTKQGTDGSTLGFSSSGSTSTQTFTIGTGQVVAFEAQFKLATTTADLRFLFGTSTSNAYGFQWTTGGVPRAIKVVAGTVTSLGTLSTVAQDTAVHSFKVTVTQGNKVEVSFDNQLTAVVADAALTMTSGSWAFIVVDGNNGTTKTWNFQAYVAMPHYSHLHSALQTAISTAGHVVGTLDDGGGGTRSISNVTTAIDSSGRHTGTIWDGSNSRSMTNVTTALDGSGRIVGNIYDGTNARTPADVLLSSCVGNQKNMAPDSDLKFAASYWTLGTGMSIVLSG